MTMNQKRRNITVFEHEPLMFDLKNQDDRNLNNAFELFFGKGKPYFSLIRNGIKFNNYVGVIQIGNTVVEVLPKTDRRKSNKETEKTWRDLLIGMLKAVHGFDVKAPSKSDLKLKNNSVLDLYFEIFVNELEFLLHKGLVKKYRKTDGNQTSLKGNLQFSKHLSRNLVHKERFYTSYTTFDAIHDLHIVIYTAIHVLKKINTNMALIGRINTLLLNFPEMPIKKITDTVFDKITFNRKTQCYKKVIEIARLIILNFHPDMKKGRNDVLALMFDMNLLWEKFVLTSLKKDKCLKVKGQNSRDFWKPQKGNSRIIKPDITITTEHGNYVLDTKWKMIERQPSMEDIRQMYVYHHYFEARKVALLYPGGSEYVKGNFVEIRNKSKLSYYECGLMFSQYNTSIIDWQKQICDEVLQWINKKE